MLPGWLLRNRKFRTFLFDPAVDIARNTVLIVFEVVCNAYYNVAYGEGVSGLDPYSS